MTDVILYDYWRSSASFRVRIALHLKGIAFTSVAVDLLAGGQRTGTHLARNPQGLVPALAIDGMMMTQSLAILEYLDARTPEPSLMPDDPAEAARLRAIAHSIAMEIHPICNPSVVTHHVAAFDGDADDKAAWMRHFIDKGLRAVEALAGQSLRDNFLHGNAPGLADCVLVPQLYNARRWGVDLAAMPRLVDIDAACMALPAFQAAAPDTARPADG
ncbi:MAG: maleylacetoacetate isomerase [Alphaproteobacteria bacterium]|jgi:maleylacetoacetate isomerase|nr:maleylacetoacetate isomerase [Alphaproteobacteria bacterium]